MVNNNNLYYFWRLLDNLDQDFEKAKVSWRIFKSLKRTTNLEFYA